MLHLISLTAVYHRSLGAQLHCQFIQVANKGSIEYVYDAAGNKLKKIVHEAGLIKAVSLELTMAGLIQSLVS